MEQLRASSVRRVSPKSFDGSDLKDRYSEGMEGVKDRSSRRVLELIKEKVERSKQRRENSSRFADEDDDYAREVFGVSFRDKRFSKN